ncbi:hypothetical protein BDZ94DRAFT_1315293 [Collybia nuda]|uniref:Nephrocystin 3-like N-terminal domain-containing protein n=1 Tax=Collybia nuda TaxID=64659 RepID=A0A9P5XSP8_9AGAR|nr:hypothetical protein BDZ94DRAFT_1315293 [Collybia nuda]
MSLEDLIRFLESLWDGLWKKKKDVLIDSSSLLPWGTWDLDPAFFSALSRWTLDHPESSLDNVLDSVRDGIDKGIEPLLGLIPDNPFPARGLIGALAHLIKLGATVTKAQKDIQQFSKEIIHWVSIVKANFENGKRGRLSTKMEESMAERKALIDEICKWASARLEDGRWSRVGHGLTIEKEIADFKMRIVEARGVFLDAAMINLSKGQDHLSQNQDAILQSIRDLITVIRQVQGDQLAPILDALNEQKQAEDRRQFLSHILATRAVANTAYDLQGKRPCDPDTRVDILKSAKKWVYDISSGAKSFLWLTGDPGCGKSAITASLARLCKDDGILWAQYFVNRNFGGTTNPASYFPSIARQLADHSPTVALAIHDALKLQPSLMDDISQLQAGKLFVDALKVASTIEPSRPVVVIIDGLDETDPSRLHFTAQIFSKAVVDLPSNIKVFIASRTEDDIRKPFTTTFDVKQVKHVHLDTASPASIKDVNKFLVKKILEIVKKHGLELEKWPGEERMHALCDHAAGLFMWAVTATKFIQDQVEMSGRESLEFVLNELSTKGMGDINVLYGTILRITHKDADAWALERFRRIVGCVAVLQEPLGLGDIASLLDLRNPSYGSPVDLEHFVRRLRTVLVAGTDAIDTKTIPRLHKSFFEFITERAEEQFLVKLDSSNGELAVACLRHLAHLSENPASMVEFNTPITLYNETEAPKKGIRNPLSSRSRGGTKDVNEMIPIVSQMDSIPTRLSALTRYAYRFWDAHLPGAEEQVAGLAILGSLDRPGILDKFRQISNYNHPQLSVATIGPIPDKKQIIFPLGNHIHLWADDGTHLKYPISGHTEKVSSVAFSPDGKNILSGSHDGTIRMWNVHNGQAIGSPLIGHTGSGPILAVAFSPDSQYFVSGSADHTLQLWKTDGAVQFGSLLKGHSGEVISVAFSPDSKQLVSSSNDWTIRLWDVVSGEHVGGPSKIPGASEQGKRNQGPLPVVFSHDGRQIIASSGENSILRWDIQTKKRIGDPIEGHTGRVSALVLTPDGRQIVSGSYDATIRHWDAQSGRSIRPIFRGFDNIIVGIALTLDGGQVISGGANGRVRFWNAQTSEPVRWAYDGRAKSMTSFGLSPDGRQIVAGSDNGMLSLWDVPSGRPFTFPIESHNKRVTCIALSKDGRMIASASLDGTIRTWDALTGNATGREIDTKTIVPASLAFSGDAKKLAGTYPNGIVRVWSIESREQLSEFVKDHINILSSIAFSSDDINLMSFNLDGTRHVWNADNGQAVEDQTSTSVITSEKNEVMSFDMERVWRKEGADIPQAQLWWHPATDPESSIWGYIHGIIVRKERSGFTSVFDMLIATRLIRNQIEIAGHEYLEVVPNELSTKGMGNINIPDGIILRITHKDTDPWVLEDHSHITLNSTVGYTDQEEWRLTEGHAGRVSALGSTLDGKQIVSGLYDTTIHH